MKWIDSHTHLDDPSFDIDRQEVLQRARTRGVAHIITIGAGKGFQSAEAAVVLATHHKDISASIGIHPHDASEGTDIERLRKLASHPKVVAIGETGLDFYRDWSPIERQYEWFESQIELAKEVGKPLIIHSRQAAKECLDTLRKLHAEEVGGVFHCYGEDTEFAARLAELNFRVSFPGTVTFKKAESVREAAKKIPLSQILIETDAPYLAPEPNRGKRCEASYVVDTGLALARLRGVSAEEIAEVTTRNACELFGITV
jgi:TatD DNase family protein